MSSLLFCTILLFLQIGGSLGLSNETLSIKQAILKDIFSRDYDKTDRPESTEYDQPLIVNANIRIYDIELDTQSGKLTIKVDLRLKWTDERLKFRIQYKRYTRDLHATLFWDDVWHPDFYFYNLQRGFVYSTPTTNRYMVLRSSGEVETMQKMALKLNCPQRNPRNYPIDIAECQMIIRSFTYYSTQLKFGWYGDNVIEGTPYVKDFQTPKIKTRARVESLATGSYSYLEATLSFGARALSPYILALHAPTSFGLLVAWLAFWVDPKQLPLRLLLASFPIVLVAFCGFRCDSQPTQVWSAFCMAFLAIELVILVALDSAERFRAAKRKQRSKELHEPNERGEVLRLLELISCVTMATIFVLATCVYWMYFITERNK